MDYFAIGGNALYLSNRSSCYCVLQMFCVLSDLSLCVFFLLVVEKHMPKFSTMNMDLIFFSFNFVKFCFIYFNVCFRVYITLGLGKGRSQDPYELVGNVCVCVCVWGIYACGVYVWSM